MAEAGENKRLPGTKTRDNLPLTGFIERKEGYAWRAASYGDHLGGWPVQPVEALAGVNEVMALDEELLFLEPVQCVPDSP